MTFDQIVLLVVAGVAAVGATVFTARMRRTFSKRDAVLSVGCLVVGMFASVYSAYTIFPRATNAGDTSAAQLRRLSEVEKSLSDLAKYVEQQKIEVTAAQQTLSALRTENRRLEPVVQTNRKLVQSILVASQAEQRTSIWTERIISFVLGILASLLASVLFRLLEQRRA